MASRTYQGYRPFFFTLTPGEPVRKYFLPIGVLFLLVGGVAFAYHMQWREENMRHVCVSPPFPVGNCDTVVAAPGERLSLNEIAQVPESGPVAQNYWVQINGTPVPVEILDDGHNGVELYATVPEPDHFRGRSALTQEQQLFQNCSDVGGRLHTIDQDGDGRLPALMNSTGDTSAYPCVVLDGYLASPYIWVWTADDIGTDPDDTNPNIP